MTDPCCWSQTKVINCRLKITTEPRVFIWRRRECLVCKKRFTTREYLDEDFTKRRDAKNYPKNRLSR